MTSPKDQSTASSEASSSTAAPAVAQADSGESSVTVTGKEPAVASAPPAVDENYDSSASYSNPSYANSSTLTKSLPPGMTLFGPTSTYRPSAGKKATKETLDDLLSEPELPLSQKILTLHPIPKAPWLQEQPSIYTVNYPRPVFSTPNKEDIPLVLGGDRQERRMKVLGAITGMSAGELRGLRRCTVESRYVVNMTKKGKM